MARMQVYLPDDLYEQVKARGLPVSKLLQKAVRAELRRLDLLAETDRYGFPPNPNESASRGRRTRERKT